MTTSSSSKNTDRPTAASVNKKTNELQSQLDSTDHALKALGERVASDHDDIADIKPRVTTLEDKLAELDQYNTTLRTMNDPKSKGSMAHTAKAADSAHRRISQLAEAVDGRLKPLEEALENGHAHGRKSFIVTLRAANVTDDKIKDVLVILGNGDEELDLTDEELFTELFTAFATYKEQLSNHAERIAALDGGGKATVSVPQLTARVTHLETAFEEVKELSRVSATVKSSTAPLAIGLVIGVIAFVVVNANSIRSGMWEFGVAAAIGFIAAGIAAFFVNGYRVSVSKDATSITSKSKSTSTTSGAIAQDDSNNPSSSDDNTQVLTQTDPVAQEHDPAPARS